MMLERRRFMCLAGAAAIGPCLPAAAWAQDYPTRPVRVLVGFAAGSAGDIVARIVSEQLSAMLGRQFFVDNRPGAGSNLAIEALVKSEPDGYTLGLANVGNAIGATFNDKLGFDINRDIAPVAGIARGTSVMEVSASSAIKTVGDFIDLARARPGQLNFASGGVGTVQHVAGELFKMTTGIDMVHVPYRGTAAALADLIAGRVHVIFDNLVSSIGQIRSGQLHPLAVTTAARSPALPNVPTVGESVPGFEASTWTGIAAPKDTPATVIAILNKAINAVLADDATKARFLEMGATMLGGSPGEFRNLIADETRKWAKVVAFSGARPG